MKSIQIEKNFFTDSHQTANMKPSGKATLMTLLGQRRKCDSYFKYKKTINYETKPNHKKTLYTLVFILTDKSL